MAKWLSAEIPVLFAVGLLTLSSAATAQTSAPATVVVDRDLTPAAGVADVLAVGRALAAVEDRLLPIRLPSEVGGSRPWGIAYRIGKWAALDLPQDSFLMVAAHEIFGHGARLREIDATGVRYEFSPPPPYGSGSASTFFDESSVSTASRADRLAIDTAGIEAQDILADDIAADAMTRGTISYRAAWLYAESRVAGLLYIRSVSPESGPGHDVAAFLSDFADGCGPPICSPIESASLKRRALIVLADPMLAFSAYTFAAAYLVQGEATSRVPMIPLPRGYRYLPLVGFAMTPYGTEWTTDHYFRAGGRLTKVSVRIGDTGAARVWGLGVHAGDVVRRGRVAIDFSGDVWRQPPIDLSAATAALESGGLAAATTRISFGDGPHGSPVGFVGEFGYKSAGFVRGERLRSGPLVRVGLTIDIAR